MQFGAREGAGRHWLTGFLLACLAGLAAAVTVLQTGSGAATRQHSPPAHPPPPPPLQVTVTGHPVLGIRANWELFARGPGYLVRIRFAAGRISRTYVPALESGNPDVAFLPQAHDVIIRSTDFVPGYEVPDGAQARLLTGPLAGGGPLIPGPAPGDAWILTGPGSALRLSLVTRAGKVSRTHVSLPPGSAGLLATAVSDGRGYVLLTDGKSTAYDAGPTWDRALPGTVAAVGPVSWLDVVCGQHYQHCRDEVITAATGAHRMLPGPAAGAPDDLSWPPAGVTSPDGQYAAVPEDHGSQPAIYLIDLRSGAVRRLGVSLTLQQATQSMTWSPDSRWLFAAAAGGKLVAINIGSGRVKSLAQSLPFMSQVAIRRAP